MSPNCCALVRVPVTRQDLVRLSAAHEDEWGSFVEWLAPSDIDMEGEPESFVELDVGRRLMVLRHQGGACHLLTPEGRCSSYTARPAPCAAYPYALVALRPAPEAAPVRHLCVLADAPCGNYLPSVSPCASDPAIVSAVERVETELNDYVKLVETWNRRQRRRRFVGHKARAAEQFLEYLQCI